jgi:hypothetical protein
MQLRGSKGPEPVSILPAPLNFRGRLHEKLHIPHKIGFDRFCGTFKDVKVPM